MTICFENFLGGMAHLDHPRLRLCKPCCCISKLAINRSVVSVFINLHCADSVFVLYGLRVCYKTLKLKKLNKLTKKYIYFYHIFNVRGV